MLAKDSSVREYVDQPITSEHPKRIHRQKKRLNSKSIVAMGILLSFVLAVFVLYGYATITKMKMDISELESRRIGLEADKEYLVANLEEIKSVSKIEDKAIVKLGMDHPRDDQVVYVSLVEDKETGNHEKEGLAKSIVSFIKGLF